MQGNLFHAKNGANAKYTHNGGEIKGIQTMAGNRVTFHDKKGAEKIVISNANNKGRAVGVGFKGDGSITIKSNGPVTVLSPTITLEAGEKGTIKLHAKTISMVAEESLEMAGKKSVILNTKDLGLEVESNMQAKVGGNLAMKAGGQAKLISSDTDVI